MTILEALDNWRDGSAARAVDGEAYLNSIGSM